VTRSDLPGCRACGGPLTPVPGLVAPDRVHRLPGRWAIHRCERCGSGTTLPLVSERELGSFYPRSYAPFDVPTGVLARAMADMQRRRDRRFPLSALATDGRPGTLLDVGCGRGDLAASWLAAGWTVLGVEPSPQAAATAARRGARIVGATLSDASVPPGSVDAVVFRHSLEHVVDPRLELGRVARMLAPGGRLAVIVPNWGSWQRRAFGERWFPLELPRHRTHFTADGLRAAIGSGGLDVIDVVPATPLITTTWSLQLTLAGRLVTESGPALLAGYAASLPVAALTRAVDLMFRSGDFLHAAAVKRS
jgi:SAM-dependent methyltransferase